MNLQRGIEYAFEGNPILDHFDFKTSARIFKTMDKITTAAHICDTFEGEFPGKKGKFIRAYRLLQPRDPSMVMGLYELHCEELLYRVVDSKDLRDATNAECLCVLSELSQKAPFGDIASTLYKMFFVHLADDVQIESLGGDEFLEETEVLKKLHGPQLYDMELELREKLYDKDRVLRTDKFCNCVHPGTCRAPGLEGSSSICDNCGGWSR